MAEMRKRARKRSDPVLPPFEHEYSMRAHGRTFVDVGQEANLQIIIGLLVVAALVRLYKIYHPSEVVFDEVHFGRARTEDRLTFEGGFGSKYIRGEFFMDVHPPIVFGKHFAARALCLIILPLAIYAFLFQVHFWALPNTGSGSGFMSPEFQATLKGNEIKDTLADVAFGSTVYIRHDATSGGYLHSHSSFYPAGSKQQQITLYPFRGMISLLAQANGKDDNSRFLIKPALETINGTTIDTNATSLRYVKNGDIIRLRTLTTRRPPVTDNEHNLEVSGYGEPGYPGDTNDHWRLEVVDDKSKNKNSTLQAIHTRFRLIHVNTWCQLFSHSVKLPEWGFGQQEVMCAKQGKRSHTYWRIEYNENPLLPADAKKTNYRKLGFWAKFFELHAVMWRTNNGLKSSHPFDSRPSISFWASKKSGAGQIYLIGNPIVWWTSSIGIFVYMVTYGVQLLLSKRQMPLFFSAFVKNAFDSCFLLFSGWFFHYYPFFLMARQLFLHHYFPALYFAILLLGGLFEVFTIRYEPRHRWIIVGVVLFVVFWVFWDLSPLVYGTEMSRRRCERIKWSKHWDWGCQNSPETLNVRKPVPAEVHHGEEPVRKNNDTIPQKQ
ncbi:hypothetical protein HDU96_010458 [Phlyctochytrium bullatum]|nr:hypothetical protein HDU96_010458 [Phlyctochytrium bullatum]